MDGRSSEELFVSFALEGAARLREACACSEPRHKCVMDDVAHFQRNVACSVSELVSKVCANGDVANKARKLGYIIRFLY